MSDLIPKGIEVEQGLTLRKSNSDTRLMLTQLENETTLVAEAQAGNAEAFVTLLNQCNKYVFRVALNITENRQDAEDVLQETILNAYTQLGGFRGESRFYTWLVRIAVNEALKKVRKRSAERQVSLDEPVETDEKSLMPREIEDWGDNPEKRYAQTELQQILTETLERLEPQFRVVFVLRDVENFSTEETATMLGMSVPAVKSRLLRARLRLRERLNKCFKKGLNGALQRANSEAL